MWSWVAGLGTNQAQTPLFSTFLVRFSQGKEEKRKAFRQKYSLADDEIAIGIIGRMVPVKNHALFVKALKIVLNKIPKHVLEMITPVNSPYINFISKSKTSELIIKLGSQLANESNLKLISHL